MVNISILIVSKGIEQEISISKEKTVQNLKELLAIENNQNHYNIRLIYKQVLNNKQAIKDIPLKEGEIIYGIFDDQLDFIISPTIKEYLHCLSPECIEATMKEIKKLNTSLQFPLTKTVSDLKKAISRESSSQIKLKYKEKVIFNKEMLYNIFDEDKVHLSLILYALPLLDLFIKVKEGIKPELQFQLEVDSKNLIHDLIRKITKRIIQIDQTVDKAHISLFKANAQSESLYPLVNLRTPLMSEVTNESVLICIIDRSSYLTFQLQYEEETLQFSCKQSTTVEDLKIEIMDRLDNQLKVRIPIINQTLIYQDKEMINKEELAYYKIGNNDRIFLKNNSEAMELSFEYLDKEKIKFTLIKDKSITLLNLMFLVGQEIKASNYLKIIIKRGNGEKLINKFSTLEKLGLKNGECLTVEISS